MSGWSYINDLPTTVNLNDGEFEIVVNLSSVGVEGNMLAHINLDGQVKDVEFSSGEEGTIAEVTAEGKVYTLKYEYATTWSRWMPLVTVAEAEEDNGNNGGTETAVRFEAENAELVSAEGGSNPIQIETNAACSNGQGVAYMQDAGNTINFNFTASAAATEVKLVICIAPATMTQTDNGSEIGELAPADLPSYCAITINGEAITFTGDPIPGNNAMNYWNVGTFTATINLAAGENVISFVSQGLAINVDYIDVYANVA